MLFTDPVFIFAFLPAALIFYYLSRHFLGGKQAIWFLVIASAVLLASAFAQRRAFGVADAATT